MSGECLSQEGEVQDSVQFFFFFLILNPKIFNILLNWPFLVLPFVCFLLKFLSREKRNEGINMWVMS